MQTIPQPLEIPMKNALVKTNRKFGTTAKLVIGLTLFYFIAKTIGHRG